MPLYRADMYDISISYVSVAGKNITSWAIGQITPNGIVVITTWTTGSYDLAAVGITLKHKN